MTPFLLNIAHLKLSEINNISSIVFDTLSINQTDSKEIMLKKFEALQSFRGFLSQYVDFNKLSSKEAKLEYIDFMDKLNQQIEDLEKLSDQISQEQLDTIAKNFAKKTDFPVGIYE
jgi:hypothetical protein